MIITSFSVHISTDPVEIYNYVKSLNATSEGINTLDIDPEKQAIAQALCVLYAKRDISLPSFVFNMWNYEIFWLDQLGPMWDQQLSEEDVDDRINALRRTPNWNSAWVE